MELPPFLLDHWLGAHEFATPPIRYNLAASTGPKWTLRALLDITGDRGRLDTLPMGYGPPEGSRALREAIGGFLGVDPDWVMATTGASEAVSILFCLSARPMGNVLLPEPAFPAFKAMANAWGLGTRHYRLAREADYDHAAAAIAGKANPQTVLALVNTPHNPTGAVMARNDIEMLAAQFKTRGVPLIVDEVYHPLYFGHAAASAAGIDNVVVMSDMSKAMSLAGLRLGWLVDADAERRKRIIDARSYFTISGSPLLEELAVIALTHHKAILERLTTVANANFRMLTAMMERVDDRLTWAQPAGGTVSFPWFRDGRDSRPFCRALASEGVLVAPGDCFGVPEHMRVGFGAQEEGFADALAIFERVLGQA